MLDFDKEFKKAEKKVYRTFWIVVTFNFILSIAVLGGIGWVIYILLKYFGIVG